VLLEWSSLRWSSLWSSLIWSFTRRGGASGPSAGEPCGEYAYTGFVADSTVTAFPIQLSAKIQQFSVAQ
jgi:hypothetical protein